MKKFCVVGNNIAYSLSPLLHKTVFAVLGVNADYVIEDVPIAEFDDKIREVINGYDGFNITKPYKQKIIAYLTQKQTRLDAVNTVYSGIGYNTDEYGFISSLKQLCGNLDSTTVLVLGAGGAAEAVVSGLVSEKAKVSIYNRTHDRAVALAEKFGATAVDSLNGIAPRLIVNCTSVGNDGLTNPLGEAKLSPEFAYDLVYSPAQTAFMTACESQGAKTANGLGMLIRQAVRADEIFLGVKLDENMLVTECEKAITKSIN